MTEAELLALARSEALKTTTTPDKFLAQVKSKPHFSYQKTHWFKAMQALEQLKHQPAPPSAGPDLSVARNLLVFATVTDDAITYACHLPSSWKALFTADPAYPVKDSHINALRASGHGVFAWGDCHSPGLMPENIRRFRDQRGLDGWYGEGESAGAFTLASATDAVGVIVNLSALSDAQVVKVAAGQVLVTAELYRNVQPNMQPDWRNANKGVGGNCIAVYASSSEGAVYTPVSKYKADGFYNPATDSAYVEGFLEADWKALA